MQPPSEVKHYLIADLIKEISYLSEFSDPQVEERYSLWRLELKRQLGE